MAKARSYPADKPSPSDWPLPPGMMPLGLSRSEAACFVGVSTTMYDTMVKDGRMPKPKRIGARTIWDRHSVERAFRELPGDDVEDQPQNDIWGNPRV